MIRVPFQHNPCAVIIWKSNVRFCRCIYYCLKGKDYIWFQSRRYRMEMSRRKQLPKSLSLIDGREFMDLSIDWLQPHPNVLLPSAHYSGETTYLIVIILLYCGIRWIADGDDGQRSTTVMEFEWWCGGNTTLRDTVCRFWMGSKFRSELEILIIRLNNKWFPIKLKTFKFDFSYFMVKDPVSIQLFFLQICYWMSSRKVCRHLRKQREGIKLHRYLQSLLLSANQKYLLITLF